MNRSNLYRLFLKNTGKSKVEMKPYVPPSPNNPFGYQKPRIIKYWETGND